jgi:hypothetical protein
MFKDQSNVSENIVVFDLIINTSDQVQINDQQIITSDDSGDNYDFESVTKNSESSDKSVSVPDAQEVQGKFHQEIKHLFEGVC